MGKRLGTVVAGVALLAATVVAGPAQADEKKETIRGGFVTPACLPVDLTVEGRFACEGGSVYTGYFTTVNQGRAEGTVSFDPATGSMVAHGTVTEFHAGRAADGSVGTFTSEQTFTQYADGSMHFDVTIVDGTGDWAGARGQFSADGFAGVGAVGGHGGYIGEWTRPER